MRIVVVLLLVANALFFIWSRGWLDAVTGLPADGGREPQRVANQQHPERIQPLAASAAAALAQRSCLELGPLEGDAALAAAQAALRGLGTEAQVRSSELPGVWVVATIKLADPEFRARKEATYKQLRLAFEPLEGLPAEQPAFVLGRHASQADAEAGMAALEKRGLKGLRVLPLKAGLVRYTLVVPQADGLLAGKLRAAKDAALASGFKACSASISIFFLICTWDPPVRFIFFLYPSPSSFFFLISRHGMFPAVAAGGITSGQGAAVRLVAWGGADLDVWRPSPQRAMQGLRRRRR